MNFILKKAISSETEIKNGKIDPSLQGPNNSPRTLERDTMALVSCPQGERKMIIQMLKKKNAIVPSA